MADPADQLNDDGLACKVRVSAVRRARLLLWTAVMYYFLLRVRGTLPTPGTIERRTERAAPMRSEHYDSAASVIDSRCFGAGHFLFLSSQFFFSLQMSSRCYYYTSLSSSQ